MTYWLARWTGWPPWSNKPPGTLKTKHSSVKSYTGDDDHRRHHHHHRYTNCIALCFVSVELFFISIPLCRPAKPPVPQSHLWSPGKWLIWKYNHSSLDFISLLSDSVSLPTLHLSYLFRHIHISLPQLSLSSLHSNRSSHQGSQLASSFILYFNTTFITCLTTLHFFLHRWSVWRHGAALSSILTYCENDEERALVNQRVFTGKIDTVSRQSNGLPVTNSDVCVVFFSASASHCVLNRLFFKNIKSIKSLWIFQK